MNFVNKNFHQKRRDGYHKVLCKKSPFYEQRILQRKLGGRNALIKQNKARRHQKIFFGCTCNNCGKTFIIKLTKNQLIKKEKFYCSSSCAHVRIISEDMKKRISASLKRKVILDRFCKNCNIKINDKNKSGYCKDCIKSRRVISDETRKRLSEAGKRSAAIQRNTRRSKNEILFYELCKERFTNVKHNEPIFNGWDADVILEDYKIAVLWNGNWHYKVVVNQKTFNRVQNRDKIKINEIKKCGFYPYLIKDEGSENKEKVYYEFNKFVDFVNDFMLK